MVVIVGLFASSGAMTSDWPAKSLQPVARTSQAARNPIKPVDGETLYGLQTEDPTKTAEGVVSSALCKDRDKPIGEVIRSDENAVQIKIDKGLCKAGPSTIKQCEVACPVVDHVTAEVNIAYGWRQFEQTAPTDIRTRGIERDINTMPDSLAEVRQGQLV